MTDLRAQLQAGLGGSYTLERELGRGGMATVFLAQDVKHDRPVALKVLHPELAMSLGPERFLREIKLAARLQHPHILTVLDSGDTGGRLWFTMPFVEGESLRDRLRRERQLPVEDAVRIAREAAQALQYAHEHGVVHRDIKPENLLLTRDGNTLVADFGIARGLQAGGGSDEKLTDTGLVVGTPAYMSPEQASGDRALDARSDVYSLGSVLYEMLAGEAPFTAPTMQAMIVKRLTEPPPSVRAVRPTVPEAVDHAIRKALAPLAADRFGTMAQFGQALLGSASVQTGAATVPTPTGPPVPSGPATPSAASAATRPVAPAEPRRSRVSPVAIALTAGLLIGGGLLFAWRHSGAGGEPPSGRRVVAVLPFDNLGDSSDAYFADGVSDEVRTKLGQVAGLEVIARNSSLSFRHTTKQPSEIARDLGADYLLTGTVRWEKSGGTSRVRVTPELVDARPGQAGHSRWGQQFDASLTDVFQVQADIATKVADALGVALADSARRGLTAKPTENLAAYDEYLKGEAASQGMAAGDPPSMRRALVYYQRAVELDSTFAKAWARLSHTNIRLYGNGTPDPVLAKQALLEAERARRLNPIEPIVYRSLGAYYAGVPPVDFARARTEYEHGLQLAPGSAELLNAVAVTEMAIGQWDSAAVRLEHAALVDPRSQEIAITLSDVRRSLRQYPAADAAADRALALAPTNVRAVSRKALAAIGRGDLASARAAVRAGAQRIDPAELYSYVATFFDLYWVLDDDQQRQVLALPVSAFDGDRGNWATDRSEIYHLRGDRAHAVIYADSARLAYIEQIRGAPDDPQRHAFLGLALAMLGRAAEAEREGQRGNQLAAGDATYLPYTQHQLMRIYLLTGQPEKALDLLEGLLKVPYDLSPGWLRIDPTFDPVRSNPRFKRLIEGSAALPQ
ncbi:MAG TPA: protein kinase [Gemmatimonadales bacterium]|nr:protein kinase [Gemmatimonadales bacterium]